MRYRCVANIRVLLIQKDKQAAFVCRIIRTTRKDNAVDCVDSAVSFGAPFTFDATLRLYVKCDASSNSDGRTQHIPLNCVVAMCIAALRNATSQCTSDDRASRRKTLPTTLRDILLSVIGNNARLNKGRHADHIKSGSCVGVVRQSCDRLS